MPSTSAVPACLRAAGKRYGEVLALDGVDLRVDAGQVLALLGPNGAGKSTAIGLLLGLHRPDHGQASLFGQPPLALAARRRIGVMLQTAALPDELRVGELLSLTRSYYPDPRSVADCVALAGLDGLLDRRYRQLSGGQQRRVQFALAICGRPQLLFLDEPTTGLDPQARHLMWERLQVLLQQGKSILLTTHFMDEAERLCHRLLVLDHGRKIAEGRPRDLIAQHLEPDVVEAYGNGALALAESPLKTLAGRTEVSGETVFFYTQDARPLLDALGREHPKLRTLHRPSNLEDLFLKLTGRQIREGS
jgi:lipooligosaccharide transport system ATP-binding protein